MLLGLLQRELFQPQVLTILRQYKTHAVKRQIPSPRGSIQTASDFLTAIGRSCETKLEVDSWDALWSMGGKEMKKKSLETTDRRYILWCLNKYRSGEDPSKFAYSEKPKKKIRGWGPKVQFGKRIRSRRYR